MSKLNSDIRLELPVRPMTNDPNLFGELNKVYEAIFILQTELSAAKARIAVLETYNIAHP